MSIVDIDNMRVSIAAPTATGAACHRREQERRPSRLITLHSQQSQGVVLLRILPYCGVLFSLRAVYGRSAQTCTVNHFRTVIIDKVGFNKRVRKQCQQEHEQRISPSRTPVSSE